MKKVNTVRNYALDSCFISNVVRYKNNRIDDYRADVRIYNYSLSATRIKNIMNEALRCGLALRAANRNIMGFRYQSHNAALKNTMRWLFHKAPDNHEGYNAKRKSYLGKTNVLGYIYHDFLIYASQTKTMYNESVSNKTPDVNIDRSFATTREIAKDTYHPPARLTKRAETTLSSDCFKRLRLRMTRAILHTKDEQIIKSRLGLRNGQLRIISGAYSGA